MDLTDLTGVKVIFIVFVIATMFFSFWWFSKKPTQTKNWREDQKILQYANIRDGLVEIFNIRDFRYSSEKKIQKNYYDKIFDLSEIKSVDYVLIPFKNYKFKGAAHSMLSFGFKNGEYVTLSIEARRRKGERFIPLHGMFRAYELMYVFGDENDLIRLRSLHRDEDVYIYPLKVSSEIIREIFISMLDRVNDLKNTPEFYSTFKNSCNVLLVEHYNEISEEKIPKNYQIYFPGYMDDLLYKLGLIATELEFSESEKYFRIEDNHDISDKDFSKSVRKWLN